MIALDNGPPQGDYVRYIERLIAETRTTGTLSGGGTVASTIASSASTAAARLPTGAPQPPARPSSGTTTRPAAGAVAAATLDRAGATRNTANPLAARGFAALGMGVVLIVVGAIAEPVRGLFSLGGFFLFGLGVKWLVQAARDLSRRTVPR